MAKKSPLIVPSPLDGDVEFDENLHLLNELLMDEMYEQSERNLYKFFINFWNTFDPQPLVNNWHLECMAEHLQAAVNREIRRLIINVPPRCVVGNARIHLADGSYKYAREIQIGDEVLSSDLTKVNKNKVTDVIKAGHLPCIQINLNDGFYVLMSEDHKVYTVNKGWLKAVELEAEDVLLCPKSYDFAPPSSDISVDEATLLGVWSAIGAKSQTKDYILYTRDENILTIVKDIARKLNWRYSVSLVGDRHEFRHPFIHKNLPAPVLKMREWFAKYVEKEYKADKYNYVVPFSIFAASKEAKRAFLSAYIASVGDINPITGKISLKLLSPQLCKGIGQLWKQLGYNPRWEAAEGIEMEFTVPRKLTYYMCTIDNPEEIERAATEFNFHHLHHLLSSLPSSKRFQIKSIKTATNPPISPNSEFIYRTVVSTTPIGQRVCYDLTVENDHTYFCEGILTHNSSKCLDADTLVRMGDGSQKPIKYIVPGETVLSLDTTTSVHKPAQVTNVIHSGIKEVYEVTLDTGETIVSTLDHKYYTWDGFKALKDLVIGDNVSVAKSYIPCSTLDIPIELVRLLALWMAEGHKAAGFRVTNYDEIIRKQAITDATTLGYKYSENKAKGLLSIIGKVGRFTLSEIITYIYKGVRPTCRSLYIPNIIFKLPNSYIIEFLAMWIATDGYIAKQGHVGITLASKQCVSDLAFLFNRLGIRTKISYRLRSYTINGVKSKKQFDSWTLEIRGLANIELFRSLFKNKLYQKNETLNNLQLHKNNTSTVPPNYLINTESTQDAYVRNQAIKMQAWSNPYSILKSKYIKPSSNVIDRITAEESWRKIVGINLIGYRDTYDITVPKYANFTLANGVHVHNSTTASICLPVWTWLNNPYEKFWLISHSAKLYMQNIVYARRILDHPTYSSRWLNPEIEHYKYHLAKDVNTKTRIENSAGGYILGGSPTSGALGMGYSIAVLDDVLDSRQANSAVAIQAVNDWYTQTFLNRSNDVNNDVQIITMQRLSSLDIVDYVQRTYPEQDWFVLNLPAKYIPEKTYISPIGFNDPRTVRNQLLDPVRLPDAYLLTQSRDKVTYNTRFQQDPEATGDGNFVKQSWIQEVDKRPINYSQMLTVWDLSFGDNNAQSSYTVGLVLCRMDDKFYVVDMFRKQCDIPQQLDAIRKLKRKYPKSIVGIEARANGNAAMSLLEREIHNIYAFDPKKFGGSKEQRLGSILNYFRDKRIYIYNPFVEDLKLEPTYDVETIKKELIAFPTGTTDDIVDCIAYGIQYLAEFGQESVGFITKGDKIRLLDEDWSRAQFKAMGIEHTPTTELNSIEIFSDMPSRADLQDLW